jgi:hypothetical protein
MKMHSPPNTGHVQTVYETWRATMPRPEIYPEWSAVPEEQKRAWQAAYEFIKNGIGGP